MGVPPGHRYGGSRAATPRCITPPCASREFRSSTFPTFNIPPTTSAARAGFSSPPSANRIPKEPSSAMPSIGRSTATPTPRLAAITFSSRGWAQIGNYRAIGWNYQFHAEYYGVIDEQGHPGTGQNQGGEELKVNGSVNLPYGFRGVDFRRLPQLLSFPPGLRPEFHRGHQLRGAFRRIYQQELDGQLRGLLMSRYQNYQSTVTGDVIDIAHIPSFQMAGVEKPIFNSKFMYTYDVAGEGVSRHEPGFQTPNVVGRSTLTPPSRCRHSCRDGPSAPKSA